jgi:uncharacterized membrane protein YgdD (TMEM256/DUF423 family)
MSVARNATIAASIAGASAVMLGAFGAHALQATLTTSALVTWHTAVDYQFWHALSLLGVAALARPAPSVDVEAKRDVAARVATWAFAIGIVLFCGSLYALALGAPRIIGVVTPFGGVALIVGWIALLVGAVRSV